MHPLPVENFLRGQVFLLSDSEEINENRLRDLGYF
jgi:hypothetical protein